MATTTETKIEDIGEKFTIEGKEYYANPTMEQFITDAGYHKTKKDKMIKALKAAEITEVEQFYGMSLKDLGNIDQISAAVAKILMMHLQKVKNRGAILSDAEKMEERITGYQYLPTGSSSLDEMMTYADGNIGWRTRTLIELYGEPSHGKTQICLTASAICLRPKKLGGWGRGVIYIDSEGAFDYTRFKRIAEYWGVEKETLQNKFFYAYTSDFDTVEMAIDAIYRIGKEIDVGMIIVDSIMDPLKAQYMVGGEYLMNLQPRQQHLKKVLDKLKIINTLFNSTAIYTNHMMANIGEYGKKKGPQGGSVLGHASDIRIELTKPPSKVAASLIDAKNAVASDLKIGRAKIVDCGFLPETMGFFLIGPMGISDPERVDDIIKHAVGIKKVGYINVDSFGRALPKRDNMVNRDDALQRNKDALYGKKTTTSGKKKK